MPGAFARSRFALILRRLRGRSGIFAPEVAIRAKVSWRRRALGIIIIAFLSAILTYWACHGGQRVADFPGGIVGNPEDAGLRQENLALQAEITRLQSLLTANESNLQIERSAQQVLSEKNTLLARENSRLREDIAVFERLSPSHQKQTPDTTSPGVVLDRLVVRREGNSNRYRYAFQLALQGSRRGRDSTFDLQIIVLPRLSAAGAKIVLPPASSTHEPPYRIVLKNFRRIEGKFELPAAFDIDTIEFRLHENGTLKAQQRVTPS